MGEALEMMDHAAGLDKTDLFADSSDEDNDENSTIKNTPVDDKKVKEDAIDFLFDDNSDDDENSDDELDFAVDHHHHHSRQAQYEKEQLKIRLQKKSGMEVDEKTSSSYGTKKNAAPLPDSRFDDKETVDSVMKRSEQAVRAHTMKQRLEKRKSEMRLTIRLQQQKAEKMARMRERNNGVTMNEVISGASDSDDDTSSTPASQGKTQVQPPQSPKII